MGNEIVQESRGIILYKNEVNEIFEPVCIPFYKFFNVQETNAHEIDWENDVRVLEKLDGSIIKMWFHNGSWRVSTNKTINSQNAELITPLITETNIRIDNYYDLFRLSILEVVDYQSWKNSLDKNYTYMLEVVSPYNRIVVPYKKTELYHIGSRNNITLEEEEIDIGIKKPKEFNLSSLDKCIEACQNMPFDEEGYVVVDKNYNRVKIKSPAYVSAHHLKNNGAITYSRVLDMIKAKGDDDFLSIYPEYFEHFERVRKLLCSFIDECIDAFKEFNHFEFETRKDFALWAKEKRFSPLLFLLLDKKIKNEQQSVIDWILNIESEKLVKLIGID